MSFLTRLLASATLCLPVLTSQGQQTTPDTSQTQTITAALPFQLPLIALVPGDNFGISLQDSLARAAYARNKVRSITKIQVWEKSGEIDSLEYLELDRRGNKVLLYNPTFQARTMRRYDARNHLIEILQSPHPGYPYQVREVMDPARNTYTAYHYLSEAPNHLYRTVTHRYHADTLVGTAELHQPEVRQGYTLTRVVSRKYTAGPDTTRLDLFGYDETGQVRVHEALYFIYKQKALVESGEVTYEQALQHLLATSAKARQQRSQGVTDAVLIARQGGELKGRYQPTAYFWYDEKGRLIKTENRSRQQKTTPSTTQGQYGTMTISSATSSQHVYQYDKQGRMIREEIRSNFAPTRQGLLSAPRIHVVIEKTYSGKGLLLTETQNNGRSVARYEYRYTYY
ncbi:hypothetical protein [Hymenobacter sp. DG01]|uniref:hypothetical protein n=1 Tax=Hymenobacter sp. DG01 TaxID=2584940 RepID=UPI001122D8C5|nr:hypothetical protein [Hymenobacter sp. DG01]